jgi:predicted ATP-grasp superfamily ATP-dependent carboligase
LSFTGGKLGNPLKRPVLILGWLPRIVLPIARSLRKRGVPVDVADFAWQFRIPSRAIREFRRIRRPDLGRAEFVEQLGQFIREGGHDMVFPTDDQTLTALTEHYDDFKDMVHIACPPPEITQLVLNKASTLEIAQECGIRVPRTRLISNSAQLFDMAGSFPFPWVLKPAEKEIRLEETKSFSLATVDEIARTFPDARAFTPPMLLQEYCEGAGVGIEVLMHEGKSLTVFQHRRLKEFPYTGGVSVTAVAEPPDPALLESSLALLRALQWEGVAMVEFKVNPDTGNAVLMEVNGRYWGTLSLPISVGIDFPWYQWQLAHGEDPQIPPTYAAGKKWRWTVGYEARLYSLLAASRDSVVARKELFNSISHIPLDLAPWISDSTMTLTDPMPSVDVFLRAMKEFIVHTVKVLLKSVFRKRRTAYAAEPRSLLRK